MSLLDSEDLDVLRDKQKVRQVKQIKKAVKVVDGAVFEKNKIKQIKIDYDKIIPEDERIQVYRKIQLDSEQYQDFAEELYPYSLNFYDFEVFAYDWCITIINPVERKMVIIANDSEALFHYYRKHKDQIWVGYNSRNYDTYIMKGILLRLNPKKINDDIIVRGLKGWQIDADFKLIKFLNFDIYTKHSLKTLEGFMGNDIRETEVDFNLTRKLTQKEMTQTIKYNIHDVEQTIEVFRRNKYLYDSQIQLIETFKLKIEFVSLTQAQLTAKILECEPKEHNDEFDINIVDTLHLHKYKKAREWFEDKQNLDYKNSFKMDVCGVPHQYGWGGLHGCPEKPLHVKGKIFHVDVGSYYPSQIIRYGFMTRNSNNPKRYVEVYEYRLDLKARGLKKEQAPYKIVLNGAYGQMKDKYSASYDPKQANNICINGQLMLTDLLEHLEPHIQLIQSNTDGLIVLVEDDPQKIEKVKNICHRWEHRTGMNLSFDEIDEIYQKDVNNYVFRFTNGKLERKGAYVQELDDLNYDLPIVNKALVDYMMKGIDVETTINECNSLKEFQRIVKVSSNYISGYHNGEYLNDKTFRVFASKDKNDGPILKCKYPIGTILSDGFRERVYRGEKFADTSEHCFICNKNVNELPISKKLDKEWYIKLAKKRLEDFGINLKKTNIGALI